MNLRIELSKNKKEFNENELKMKRLFWELQTLANPFYTSVSNIKSEEILQCAKDMQNTKTLLISLDKTINDLKDQLGE
jgi:hypothetical protein